MRRKIRSDPADGGFWAPLQGVVRPHILQARVARVCAHRCPQVPFSSFLKRFGVRYFGVPETPTSNLIRKMYHSALLRMSREGQAMDLMRKVHAHSAEVARKVAWDNLRFSPTPGEFRAPGRLGPTQPEFCRRRPASGHSWKFRPAPPKSASLGPFSARRS